jgi:hypothetical protein
MALAAHTHSRNALTATAARRTHQLGCRRRVSSHAPHLSRAGVSVRACAQQSTQAAGQQQPEQTSSRRAALLATVVAAVGAAALPGRAEGEQQVVQEASPSDQEAIKIVQDTPGFGQHGVRQGELVLVHYVGEAGGGRAAGRTLPVPPRPQPHTRAALVGSHVLCCMHWQRAQQQAVVCCAASPKQARWPTPVRSLTPHGEA